ncbi:MAG TPA: hypothetical protein VJR26_14835 [Candidatus Acidoferrales bacterium]|nr:hypothetical protein [Candidatus Acidoferrales bacterium]
MRTWKSLCFSVLLIGAAGGVPPAHAQPQQQQPPAAVPASPVRSVNQAIDRITARERVEVAIIRHYKPLIETYIQDMKPDPQMGLIPVSDHYFLGQADLATGIVDNSMLAAKKGRWSQFNPLYHVADFFRADFVPAGFLQMIYVDTTGFDRQHYRFDYVRQEFLGSVKCLVFDVTPLPKSGRGRFKGRIWAEDQDYTIVRFNGVYTPVSGLNGYNLHFDSWRLNLQPNLWLPAYIFSQESDLRDLFGGHVRFRCQTRLWGYDLAAASRETEFSSLTIESPAVQDQAAAQQQDRSPIEAEREWQHEAEMNVLDRLQRVGLLAPPGEVDKVLDTVENNLEVSNDLDVEPRVHCRVLLTGTLESFSIGHTIVLSRGLIDVLPDEASLATVVAQDLADLLITKPSTDQYGFNDTTNVSTLEVLNRFSFRDTPQAQQAASAKALELLKKSPYKDKLGNAGLFLKSLADHQKALSALINPRLGNGVFLAQQLIEGSPQLQPAKLDQIAALPIGARIKVDPWDDDASLLKAKPVPLYSVREKMPFEVTPFEPFLTRYQKASSAVTEGDPAKADLARQQQPQ